MTRAEVAAIRSYFSADVQGVRKSHETRCWLVCDHLVVRFEVLYCNTGIVAMEVVLLE